MEIEYVSEAFILRMFGNTPFNPIGKYIVPNKDGTWTAIDNSTGDAWTEDFASRRLARRWLNGKTTKNTDGDVIE